ncbi:ribitol-5-phosphate xylosyltransferase 1-like [Babylonia areolata]|uniref:ribitol-5-phosphate xylosyltransferase 1-like n=1 Tax=Babylonia areolata TaxID=304850 RepID=UPI003FD4F422
MSLGSLLVWHDEDGSMSLGSLLVWHVSSCRFLEDGVRQEVVMLCRKGAHHDSFEISDDADWNPWGEEFEEEGGVVRRHHQAPEILWGPLERPLGKRAPLVSPDNGTATGAQDLVVEVWGKAAIGLYLWEHIFNAELEEKLGGVWSYGTKKIGAITFRFRTGPGVIPSKVPHDVEHVLLVLNGREPAKVDYARMWLDLLPTLPRLRNAALLLLGNERCQNGWLKPYMWLPGSRLRSVFLVYDSPWVDNVQFYQWPLGVATYRQFPKVESRQLPLSEKRRYTCNFLGTVYRGSSRETLLHVLTSNASDSLARGCLVKPRMEWLPQETEESRGDYLRAVQQSDLTLSPVGQNTECYRIYEAMAFGSVPVIEDVMTPGECGASQSSKLFPLRLLKELDAPVIFLKDWSSLPQLLLREQSLSHQERVRRRERVVQWYDNFKAVMRDRLVRVLENRFFNINR